MAQVTRLAHAEYRSVLTVVVVRRNPGPIRVLTYPKRAQRGAYQLAHDSKVRLPNPTKISYYIAPFQPPLIPLLKNEKPHNLQLFNPAPSFPHRFKQPSILLATSHQQASLIVDTSIIHHVQRKLEQNEPRRFYCRSAPDAPPAPLPHGRYDAVLPQPVRLVRNARRAAGLEPLHPARKRGWGALGRHPVSPMLR